MPTQITGTLGSPDPSGVLIPLAGAKLYVSPSQPTQLRIQYGGSGEFMLVTPNPQLPVPYQYGFVATTDASGVYDFDLPEAAEIHTPDTAFKWNLSLPDGSVYSGPALAVTGPLSIDDLLLSNGWTLSSGLQVQTSVLGQVAQQTVTVTAQDTILVSFLTPMADGSYQVICNPGADTTTDQVPSYEVSAKTGAGFTITLSFPLTGTLDFIAWHP